MKKILSLILAMAMILSSFSFAFALPSDVEDTEYENAVARLAALDIIVGYEDGTFRPGNSITRAEFAAIAIRMLGMEDIANGSVANTKFPDVRVTHWASGYINLASARGIIVGYSDGTFKPEEQVTYSEAVTMLVRLLGYEPALNSNEWPSNYLTKASEIGLTLGIKFNYNDPAKRGVVSTLVNKALDIDLMDLAEVTSGDQTWKITDYTLLTKYLNVFELEDAYVVETASHSLTKLDADEVKIRTEEGKTYTFKMIESIDADSLLGHEVTVFIRDTDTDGKIEDDELVISIQDTTDPRDVIAYDYIVDITKSDEDNYKIKDGGIEIALDETDDEFELAEDAIVFYNYERVTDLAKMASNKVGEGYGELGEVAGKIILNDDEEIIYMNMINYDLPRVITDVNLKDEKVKYFTYTDSESTLKLDGEKYTVMKNGEIAELEDLATDDVLYFWEVGGTYVLEAYDYKIEGILDSVDSDNNMYWDYTLVVDGKSISVGPAFTISTDENDTINSLATNPSAYEWTADDDRLSDIEDMVGEYVVVYIGKYYEETEGWNYGRHITTDVNTSSDDYFIVTEDPWASRTAGYKYYVELLNQFDDETTYEFTEDDTEFNGKLLDLSISKSINGDVKGRPESGSDVDVTNLFKIGTLVEVDFNGDGTISSINVIEAGNKNVIAQNNTNGGIVDDDYDRIKINNKVYYVSDETVYFGVNTTTGEAEAYTWGAVSDLDSGDDFSKVISKVDDSEIEVIVFYHDGSVQIGEDDYGYVLKREIRKDGLWVFMAVEGEIVEYYAGDLSRAAQNSLQEKVLVDFTVSVTTLDTVRLVPRTKFFADANEMTNNMFKVVAGIEVTSGTSIKAATVSKNDIKLDDVVIAKWNTTDEKLDSIATGYSASDFSFAFDKFEIVSGGIDTRNGIIEVMAAGTDEDEDMTWFVHIDKYGNDSFFYDVDTSHRNLENKILSLGDLADGDMIHIYDVSDSAVAEYIAIYDR
ncbi:S-layer homology domain-containing protein [Sedimentibacter hydroxybenzoicus DSM 7310]|uniref:S-layer homology domain-containing protein n=1 Tax=Sedimentibacter hydroxybenzoicus DSM 7310 TaxID=1123245 RepID=A0A974BK58_SEDHY|nr:S-layer homology domain-containing protein [Sedimentibacter hydroxybenzoicus]NYB74674.1 S-layer homology domain-containing protein [Sedimentibacter hydroxybenzoicus DSM 7310]